MSKITFKCMFALGLLLVVLMNNAKAVDCTLLPDSCSIECGFHWVGPPWPYGEFQYFEHIQTTPAGVTPCPGTSATRISTLGGCGARYDGSFGFGCNEYISSIGSRTSSSCDPKTY